MNLHSTTLLRRRRIAEGKCRDCAKPATPGSARCANCREERRLIVRAAKPASRFTCGRCGSRDHTRRACPEPVTFVRPESTGRVVARSAAHLPRKQRRLVVEGAVSPPPCEKGCGSLTFRGWTIPSVEETHENGMLARDRLPSFRYWCARCNDWTVWIGGSEIDNGEEIAGEPDWTEGAGC